MRCGVDEWAEFIIGAEIDANRERRREWEWDREQSMLHTVCVCVCVCVFVCASSTPLTVIIQCQNLMSPNCSCWQRRAMKLNAAPCGGNRAEQSRKAEGGRRRAREEVEKEQGERSKAGNWSTLAKKYNLYWGCLDFWVTTLFKQVLSISSLLLLKICQWKKLEVAGSVRYMF